MMKRKLKASVIAALVIFCVIFYMQKPKNYFYAREYQKNTDAGNIRAVVLAKAVSYKDAQNINNTPAASFFIAPWQPVKNKIINAHDFEDYFKSASNANVSSHSYVGYAEAQGHETRVYFARNEGIDTPRTNPDLSDFCRFLGARQINDFQIVRSKKIASEKK